MNDGRTKKSIANIIGSVCQQIITILLNFISRTVFIRTLGVAFLGINGLFTDILGLLSMADLGLNTAMTFSFYKPLAMQDKRQLAALTTFYKKVYNIIAIVVATVGILLTPFVRLIVNTDVNIPNLEIYYLFSVASVVISYLWVYRTSILTKKQKNYYISRIQIVVTFVRTIFQIVVLLAFKSYLAYLFLGVVFNFVPNFIASKKAVELYPFILNNEPISQEDVRSIFYTLKSVVIFKLSSVLLNATDNTLISIIVGTLAVGYYSNYLMINNKLILLFSVFFTSLTASIGNLIVKENTGKRYEIFNCAQTVSFMFCGIIIPCYISLINDLITVWLGSEFCMSSEVVLVIALNLYMSCAMQPLWSYREATGLYTKTKWVMLIAAVENIILSIILGNIIGVAGILLASVISRITTYVWYEPILLFKIYFEKSSKSYFISLGLNFLFVTLFGICLHMISSKLIVSTWLTLFFKALMIGIVTIVIVVLIYCRTDGFQLLLRRTVGKFKRSAK